RAAIRRRDDRAPPSRLRPRGQRGQGAGPRRLGRADRRPHPQRGARGVNVLVNFFYAQPVGHAVEALHYAHGHHAADPSRRISVALNAATPVELAGLCPFIEHAHAIEHPFVEAGHAPLTLPREWDWVLDDPRRHQPFQTETFAGMRDYYAASDADLIAKQGRSIA